MYWILPILIVPLFSIVGLVDSSRFEDSSWHAAKLDRGVFRLFLALAAVLWVLGPVTIYYWLYLRWKLRANDLAEERSQAESRNVSQ